MTLRKLEKHCCKYHGNQLEALYHFAAKSSLTAWVHTTHIYEGLAYTISTLTLKISSNILVYVVFPFLLQDNHLSIP